MMTWRGYIGLICPSMAVTTEDDFKRNMPEGVGVCSMHIYFEPIGPTPENLREMVKGLEGGCKIFDEPRARPDVIIFGCTSGSMINGFTFDKECIKLIEDKTGVRGLTTSTAVLEAFETLGVSRPAVITPYPEATNVMEKAFLEANGLTVTNIVDMNKQRLWVPLIEPTYVYQQIKKMDLNGADSIFISCTGLNILSMIPIIEEDFGLPVITSNQASIWASLRYARIGAKNPKLGKLMREF